jgi:hypothetical protein
LARQRQAEDAIFDPTNCTINNQILYNHPIAWNVDYVKFTGGGAWLIDSMHRVETCESDKKEKYT